MRELTRQKRQWRVMATHRHCSYTSNLEFTLDESLVMNSNYFLHKLIKYLLSYINLKLFKYY
ncbi:hypothetical protein OIU77_002499 [Salix suchowensis]|uniref:Uncharacterized protein n=1 Tax=Salix suchowensis TaxID=1278906 RepID=A0ABQ9AY74_9ROSI|nr:hypothetical protein OIU77_002499 [Salix suchowensis]